VPLNLPHAGRIAHRIVRLLPAREALAGGEAGEARRIAAELIEMLDPCLEADENPPAAAGEALRQCCAALGRSLVVHIERGELGGDRIGQCVRNFFECLELGPEGADISLRAGENPGSLQRPF
jgi:hypothetical protein